MPADAETLRARLAQALSSHPEVLEAYLFGSFARGAAQPHSDVDVAVWVSGSPTRLGYEATLAAELISALGEDRVDVVPLNRAPPLLYHRVLRDGLRLLARDPRATTAREGAALSRSCDWVAYPARLGDLTRARVASGEFGR